MIETKSINAPAINLIDESFDSKKSNQYHLSIVAGENNFTFSVLDTNTNKYLLLRSNSSIEDLLKILPNGCSSVTCAVAHNKFTLVPSALFDEENKKSLLGFNHPVEGEEEIHSDTLHNLEAKNIFTVSASFESAIRKHFINVRFIHSSTAFIEGLLVQNKNLPVRQAGNSGKKVFANFHAAYFEIVILEGRELLFSNAFKYKSAEDIAYYVLFVYEQLHLNPEEIELVLSGEIEKTDKEHSLLYNYIRHIKFASLPDGFKYSYKFDEIQPHRFFSLFNQYLCA